jgi:hypothetical protein
MLRNPTSILLTTVVLALAGCPARTVVQRAFVPKGPRLLHVVHSQTASLSAAKAREYLFLRVYHHDLSTCESAEKGRVSCGPVFSEYYRAVARGAVASALVDIARIIDSAEQWRSGRHYALVIASQQPDAAREAVKRVLARQLTWRSRPVSPPRVQSGTSRGAPRASLFFRVPNDATELARLVMTGFLERLGRRGIAIHTDLSVQRGARSWLRVSLAANSKGELEDRLRRFVSELAEYRRFGPLSSDLRMWAGRRMRRNAISDARPRDRMRRLLKQLLDEPTAVQHGELQALVAARLLAQMTEPKKVILRLRTPKGAGGPNDVEFADWRAALTSGKRPSIVEIKDVSRALLSCGVRVVHLHDKRHKTLQARLIWPLEQRLGRATKRLLADWLATLESARYRSRAARRQLSEDGARVRGLAGQQLIGLAVDGVASHWRTTLSVVAAAARNPIADGKTLGQVRSRYAASDWSTKKALPSSREVLAELAFGRSNSAGDPGRVALMAAARATLRRSRLTVAVSAAVPSKQLMAAASDWFCSAENDSVAGDRDGAATSPLKPKKQIVVVVRRAKRAELSLGYELPYAGLDRLKVRALAGLLRLRLRSNPDLRPFLVSGTRSAVLGITISGQPDATEKLVHRARAALEGLVSSPPASTLLRRLLERLDRQRSEKRSASQRLAQMALEALVGEKLGSRFRLRYAALDWPKLDSFARAHFVADRTWQALVTPPLETASSKK